MELCDEAGHVLGTFLPERAEQVEAVALAARPHEWDRQDELGPELDVYGYVHDID